MEETPRPLAQPKDKLVMIVDDDNSVLELLDYVLRREGFRVEKAADGEEALRKIGALRPDLVLLDLMLPRYGGFEVLRQLQKGSVSSIPIVVISGRYTDRSTIELVMQESNVVEFIPKPIRPAVLSAMLHRILGTLPPEINDRAGSGH